MIPKDWALPTISHLLFLWWPIIILNILFEIFQLSTYLMIVNCTYFYCPLRFCSYTSAPGCLNWSFLAVTHPSELWISLAYSITNCIASQSTYNVGLTIFFLIVLWVAGSQELFFCLFYSLLFTELINPGQKKVFSRYRLQEWHFIMPWFLYL